MMTVFDLWPLLWFPAVYLAWYGFVGAVRWGA